MLLLGLLLLFLLGLWSMGLQWCLLVTTCELRTHKSDISRKIWGLRGKPPLPGLQPNYMCTLIPSRVIWPQLVKKLIPHL